MYSHLLRGEASKWRHLLLTGFLVLQSVDWAVLEPTYEVPHPALSRAAISDGKGKPQSQVLL